MFDKLTICDDSRKGLKDTFHEICNEVNQISLSYITHGVAKMKLITISLYE